MTEREQIIETVNKLFYYTDIKNWKGLIHEVFASKVLFDMSSLGAEAAKTVSPEAICDQWEAGLQGLDAVHHQAGNYLVCVSGAIADVICYGIASHYKANDNRDKTTRTFVGSYRIKLEKQDEDWRISGFTFHLKYITGNLELT